MKNIKTHTYILLSFFILFLLDSSITETSNWKSTSSSNSTDEEKQHINFYGTLITHQGQKDIVDHILIEGKHNDIIMYDAPVKHSQEAFNQKTKQTEIKLDENPITDFMHSKIDLNTISAIKVPTPNTIWIYQKEKKYQKMEFLLVTVTLKESTTTKSYLLERKTHISCNTIDNGSQKKEVPLSAIDTLLVEGYSFTLNTEKEKKDRPAPCTTKTTLSDTINTKIYDNNHGEYLT